MNISATSAAVNFDAIGDDESAILTVPRLIVGDIQDNGDIRVSFTVFNKTTLFPVRRANVSSDNNTSSVVSSQVVSASVAGIADGATLNAPVRFSLRLRNITIPTNYTVTNRRCVYWDTSAAGKYIVKIPCILENMHMYT